MLTRRKFIKIAGATLAVAAVPGCTSSHTESPPPSFGGLTPNADFYVYSWTHIPQINVQDWRLKIYGLVNQPLSLSYDDIKRLPSIEQTLTLECISNPPDGKAISNARWIGAKLRPLLERAGVRSNAVYVAMRSADGYYTGVPIDTIMRDENWLPYLMNGVPLPPAHGYPLRIFIPGTYGMKQPKWITEIEFVDHEFIGKFEAKGWSNESWRKVNSGFFYPQPAPGLWVPRRIRALHPVMSVLDMLSLSTSAAVRAPVTIAGWALAGPSGVKRVQVSSDDGASWHDAEIAENPSPYIWTVWKYQFTPQSRGEYVVKVKATDGNGKTQPKIDVDTSDGMSAQPRMRLDVTSVA
jgi:DMSO/TMAO reductase YedYZ molybdopterin-dependent catalytic subunit